MNTTLFLAAAYLVIWAGVFTYLLVTGRRHRHLARRVEMLEERCRQAEVRQ
ncbi:CcmD family protein [Thermodesulfobacteriota bacterium B35]